MRALRKLADRLTALWRAATWRERLAGVSWYTNARRTCRAIARESGRTLATVCGVVAAISPRLGWTYNVNAARALCKGETPTGVFRASLIKARAILLGKRPLNVLGGPKVRAFYRALMGDRDAAVVDVWTARAAGLDPEGLTPRQYAQVAAALRMGARDLRTSTVALQAVAWVAVRGRP